MSNEPGDEDFRVAWADIDDEELEEMFDEVDDDPKEDTMDEDADEATHPSTQFTAGQSSDEEEEEADDDDDDDTSSEEEGPRAKGGAFPAEDWENNDDHHSRPSWVTESTSNDGNSLMEQKPPPPYTPSPSIIRNNDVERLTSGNSRLASYRSDLKLRFSDASGASSYVDNNTIDKDIFPKADHEEESDSEEEEEEEEEKAFQESPWPGDDKQEEQDEDADREEEGGDAFSPEILPTVKKQPTDRVPSLTKELSSTWMKFDDEKWDSSKHDREEGGDTSSSNNNNNNDKSRATNPVPAKTPAKKKKKNGKQSFSLEAGLAKVSSATKGTQPMGPKEEQQGGEQANELISFWGEGEEEEDEEANANDPLAMALKAKPPEQQERRYNDSAIFKAPNRSPTLPTNLSTSAPGNKGNNEPQKPGWLQQGLGTALGIVTSNLPFSSKPKEDQDEKVEEDNVVEVDDVSDPNYSSSLSNADPLLQPSHQQHRNVMSDVSAMSDDYDILARYSGRSQDLSAQQDNADPRAGTAPVGLPNDKGTYDPCQANVNAQSDGSSRIKFAMETKAVPKVVHATPIFDLVMDLPHPAADPHHFPKIFIGAPSSDGTDTKFQSDIQDRMQEITCFAFPDYDSTVVQEEEEDERTNTYRYAKTPLEVPGFQYFTFTMALQSGDIIYAHVRRYLPPHKEVAFRYDVGRRLGRAMVIFSRYPGGDDVFLTVLKTLDVIASQHNALHSMHILRPQKLFLQNFYSKHQRLCDHYAPNLEDRRGGPHIITMQGLEFADNMEHYSTVDATHFFLPTNLLHSPAVPNFQTSFNCSMLPLLRSLGVVNALRLFSALLSERRIILVSISPTRLDRSIRAALAMLAQGMLNWPHLCIPVLPPDLWSKLKSPSPYLVGVMAPLEYRLELTDGLGDVVIFNLDENTIATLGDQPLAKLVPDLCRCLSETMLQKRRIALPENVATEKDMTAMAILNSTSDFLAQDLVEIVKADKNTMNGTAATAKKMAKTAKEAVKSTLKYFLGGGSGEEGGDEDIDVKKSSQGKRMEPDAIFIEGCRNEAGEEAVRLAFVSFFVRVLGNAEGYVVATEDANFRFNKDYFLKQRKERGDGQGSPMWAMLLIFCETQMVRNFVRLREEYIRQRQPIPIDAPLFWQCVDFLELKNIDFGILNVRSVARMLLQKTSTQQMLPSNVRRLAMAITSKRKFEGHMDEAIADLAELSRESCSALYDVMSVVWLRARTCKGLQWVHGYQAMRVLKALLLHGPLPAVADAADGLQTIRMLAFRRSQGSEQIRVEAMEIYSLLADRSKLFLRRRMAAEQRRRQSDSDELPLLRDTRFNLQSAFKDMHAAMNPAHRPPEPSRRRASLSSRRASLSSRLPHRFSISKHIMALEPLEDSITSFPAVLPGEKRALRHSEFLHDTMHRPNGESAAGSLTGDFASARRYVREIARKTQEDEKERTRESVRRRDANAMGVEIIKKQFMLLKVAIYLGPVFYFFGNHEHFLTIVMFVWLSQQLQVFRAPIDSGAY